MQFYVKNPVVLFSCLPTLYVHLLGYVCMSEEYTVCVYSVQLVQKLQEQTDRSSLHSGASGKPLIKQRDRNWPSWWYNLYKWNTQSAHPRTVCKCTQIHMHLHIPPLQNIQKCRHKQTANACTPTCKCTQTKSTLVLLQSVSKETLSHNDFHLIV